MNMFWAFLEFSCLWLGPQTWKEPKKMFLTLCQMFFKIWNLTKVRGPSKLKGSHLFYKEILSREVIENTWIFLKILFMAIG
jgi:hypothetical protein